MILDGKLVRDKILDNLKIEISKMQEKPKLAVIYIGYNSASDIYIKNKEKACNKVGILFELYHLDNPSTEDIKILINKLNNDNSVNGIIIQSPIPSNLDYNYLCNLIKTNKDVDGFTKDNVYKNYIKEKGILPCTAKGILELLNYYKIELDGKHVVIIGRSNIVGKPLINTLLNKNATVTICHSHTKDLKNITNKADIIISATGKPKLINKDFIKKDAIVIDVGITRVNNKIYGDVNFDEVKDIASYITPVPGGVGPMTIAMLLQNTYLSKKGENNNG